MKNSVLAGPAAVLLRVIGTALGSPVPPAAAAALAPPDQSQLGWLMPELAGTLPLGPAADGIWHGAVDRDPTGHSEYQLANAGNATSIYYSYMLQQPDDAASLAVDVSLPSAGATRMSGAGLMFDFHPAGRSYCAFVLHPDGVAGLYVRDRKGLHTLAQAPSALFSSNASNRLQLRRDGPAVTGFVNGREAFRLTDAGSCGPGSSGTATGPAPADGEVEGTGIIAFSVGRFGFRNLDLH
ncbi:MAG: hypothetical protein RLO22_28365 [Sneathiellaceae bacterium]